MVHHATFIVEKTYPLSPRQVFEAWADPKAKARWFMKADEFDFRIGGREIGRGGPPKGPIYTFTSHFQDIVPNQRIIFSHTLDLGETRISVSLTTVEFKSTKTGTKLIFTEQGAYLDGLETPEQRELGTKEMLDTLEQTLLHE